jgi:peptidoglycan/LPS O-acetylase OafA/YrhL
MTMDPDLLGTSAPKPVDLTAHAALAPIAAGAGRWPVRRRVAAAALAALLAVVVAVTSGWDVGRAPLWSALTLATIVLAALTLATYLPARGQGWRPDLGCGSCALVAGFAAGAGTWLAVSSAFDGGTASLGLALAGAALAKRLTDPVTCEA